MAKKKSTSKKQERKHAQKQTTQAVEKDGPREGSKTARLLAALAKGGDLAALAKASGFDEKNVRTAIGNLRAGRVAGGAKYDVELDTKLVIINKKKLDE